MRISQLFLALLAMCMLGQSNKAEAQVNQVFGNGTVLAIYLTDNSDTLDVWKWNIGGGLNVVSYIYVDNGYTVEAFPATLINEIYIDCKAGNDHVTMNGDFDAYLRVFGRDGNDFIDCGGCNGSYADGGRGRDTILGTDEIDVLRGGDGNDVLKGFGEFDILYGGNGNDSLLGGDGDDWLNGNSGRDWLEGGAGDDHLRPGIGEYETKVVGNGGADKFFIVKKNGQWIQTTYVKDVQLKAGDRTYFVGN